MRRLYTLHRKASNIIAYFRSKGYKISDNPDLYTTSTINKIGETIDSVGIIVIARRSESTEILVPDRMASSILNDTDPKREFSLVEFKGESHTSNKYLTRHVLNSLKRAQIDNPILLNDLEQQSADIVEDDITPNETFIMEDAGKNPETKGDNNNGRGNNRSRRTKRKSK